MKKVVFLLLSVWAMSLPGESSFADFRKKNWLAGGDVLFRKAGDEMKNDHINAAIEIIREFLLLYPDHPDKIKAQTMLSNAYKKTGLYYKAVKIDTTIYMNNPGTETGIRAWLDAARGYHKIGDMAKARFILEKISEQGYDRNLAEEAALELKILKITEDRPENTSEEKI